LAEEGDKAFVSLECGPRGEVQQKHESKLQLRDEHRGV
jgi:hypothetical protein